MNDLPHHIVGSDNVFADLGVPDPEMALAKAKIVQRLATCIEERGLAQTQAGAILGIDQASLSKLLRGRVRGYTLDRLLRFLTALDVDVELVMTPTPPGQSARGRIVVLDSGEARPSTGVEMRRSRPPTSSVRC